MHEVQGLSGFNVSNSVTPQAFNRNCYISCYNLSTSTTPNLLRVTPTVPKQDSITVKVSFSDPLPEAIEMIVWHQYASNMTIATGGQVGLSFYTPYNMSST